MAYSTSYVHSGKLLDSWNVWNAVIRVTVQSDQAELAFCHRVASNLTERSPIGETNGFSASQDIRRIHKNRPPVSIQSQINPIRAPPPPNLLKILFNII